MCRVTAGDSSPMTVARDAAKRSVTGEGRDATTSARPRPEPAVARTEEVAQGERERVDPLEIVDEQGGGTLSGELAMDGLEDPDRVEAADLGARVEQSMEGPILCGRREPAEQRGGRGQRHARLRLVTGEPVDRVAVERPPGFVQEARLPDPGVPHEEQRAHAPFAPRRSDQRANGRHLVRPTDEHRARRRGRRAATPACRRRVRPAPLPGGVRAGRCAAGPGYDPERTWTSRRPESPPNPPAWTQ